MIGVTGTNNQDPALRDCMKTFKIYASKLEYRSHYLNLSNEWYQWVFSSFGSQFRLTGLGHSDPVENKRGQTLKTKTYKDLKIMMILHAYKISNII
jgi:hypothetical protein